MDARTALINFVDLVSKTPAVVRAAVCVGAIFATRSFEADIQDWDSGSPFCFLKKDLEQKLGRKFARMSTGKCIGWAMKGFLLLNNTKMTFKIREWK